MAKSIKQVLEDGKKNVSEKAYTINDIMTLRKMTAASEAVGPGNTLSDIKRWITNRQRVTGTVENGSMNSNDYPAGTVFADNTGKTLPGTGTIYELYGAKLCISPSADEYDDELESSGDGDTTTGLGFKLKIDGAGKTAKVMYEYTSGQWLEIPAFKNIFADKADDSTAMLSLSNSANILLVIASPSELTFDAYLTRDLYLCSNPIHFDGLTLDQNIRFGIDLDGRFYILRNENVEVYSNLFNEIKKTIIAIPKFDQYLGFMSYKNTHAQYLAGLSDSSPFRYIEIIPPRPTDEVGCFQVPAVVSGSLYIDNTVVELKGLGFTPDKVILTFHTNTKVSETMMILSSHKDFVSANTMNNQMLSIAHRKLASEESPQVVKTITDVATCKNSGIVSGDGFILSLSPDYIGTVCDYTAFGQAAGLDPYLS